MLPLLLDSWNCWHLGNSNLLIVISSRNFLVLVSLPFRPHLTFMPTFFYKYTPPLGSVNLHLCGAAYNLLTILVLFLFVGFLYAPTPLKMLIFPRFHIYPLLFLLCILSNFMVSTIAYKRLIPKLPIFTLDFPTGLQIHISMNDLWASRSQHILNGIYHPCFHICSSCIFVSFVGIAMYHSGVWKQKYEDLQSPQWENIWHTCRLPSIWCSLQT